MINSSLGPFTRLVCVVDDDEMVRASMRMLIETVGIEVRTYASAQALVEDREALNHCGCLVLDVRMPGLSGLDLQEKLKSLNCDAPIIFITGHGDVPMAVRAMRSGALDFLQKPFNEQMLLDRVQQALNMWSEGRASRRKQDSFEARLACLTPREREVLDGMVAGRLNKQIAAELDISTKTVEQHRARIMQKMHVDSFAELVRLIAVRNAAAPANGSSGNTQT